MNVERDDVESVSLDFNNGVLTQEFHYEDGTYDELTVAVSGQSAQVAQQVIQDWQEDQQ